MQQELQKLIEKAENDFQSEILMRVSDIEKACNVSIQKENITIQDCETGERIVYIKSAISDKWHPLFIEVSLILENYFGEPILSQVFDSFFIPSSVYYYN